MPFPKEPVDVAFYARDEHGEYMEYMKITVDPEDYFIMPAPKLPYSIYNVYGDYPVENAVDIVLLPDGYTEQEILDYYHENVESSMDDYMVGSYSTSMMLYQYGYSLPMLYVPEGFFYVDFIEVSKDRVEF